MGLTFNRIHLAWMLMAPTWVSLRTGGSYRVGAFLRSKRPMMVLERASLTASLGGDENGGGVDE
jgi:hypothetical protein